MERSEKENLQYNLFIWISAETFSFQKIIPISMNLLPCNMNLSLFIFSFSQKGTWIRRIDDLKPDHKCIPLAS